MDLLSSTTIQFRPPTESTGDSSEPGIYTTVANESYIAVSFSDGSIHVLSAQTGSLVLKQPLYQANPTLIGGIAFDGDSLIFSLCKSPDLTVFDIPSETVLYTVTCPDDQWIQYLVTAQNDADGYVVVVAHCDGSICVREMRTRQHIWTMKVHDEYLGRCVVSGAQVITSSLDGTFAVSNWQTGQIEWKKRLGSPMRLVDGKWAGGFGTVFAVWDGKVAVGTNDGRLVILDLNTGEQIAEWQASDSLFQQVSILDDEYLIQASWGLLKIWSCRTYELVRSKRIFDRVAESFALLNGAVAGVGRDAASEKDRCGLDPGLKLWKLDLTKESKEEETAGDETGIGADVMSLGFLARYSTRLMALDHERVAVCVLRKSWSVEIWKLQNIDS